MPPCLTLSIIRLGSRVKWSNPKNIVAPGVVAIEKGAFESPMTKVANFTYLSNLTTVSVWHEVNFNQSKVSLYSDFHFT